MNLKKHLQDCTAAAKPLKGLEKEICFSLFDIENCFLRCDVAHFGESLSQINER